MRLSVTTLTAILLTAAPAWAKSTPHTANDGSPVTGIVVLGWWAVCVWVVTRIAKSKGRNPVPWGIAALFFNWLVLIAVAVVGPRAGYVPTKKQTAADTDRIQAQLAAIGSGQITAFVPVGVMPLPGEEFFWQQRAQYGQTQRQQTSRGSSPALYLPLGHGVRMRVGGYQGSSQTVNNFVWGPMGTVYLSNVRLLFKTDDGNVAYAPYDTILTYDAFPDGLALNVTKIGVMQFKTGDPCLGAIFLKMARQPSNAPAS
jgi:hypothetical protein